jgi:hypothetical protein
VKSLLPPSAAAYSFDRDIILRFRAAKSQNDVSIKILFGASRRIMFCETHHFHDFAKRNRENDASQNVIWREAP